ncbi:AAA family ATPase [Streptomyces sp. NPDC093109]|uniref:helix-turn-helix transcriptional regulator n=1 Tax=Streptomyces sp. NPDC093109 TaxID=3154977 RepID=UPI00344DC58C
MSELARIRAALRDARRGVSSVIVVSGPLGIGRTALLRRLPHLITAPDVRVLRAQACPAEQDFAFGVVRQLLDSGSAHTDGTIALDDMYGAMYGPDGATHGSAHDTPAHDTPAHGMPRPADAPAAAILHGPHALLALGGDRACLLLLVDDLPWADIPSLRWLAHLTRRLGGLRAVVVCTVRDGDPRAGHPLVREITGAAGDRLRPAPLSPRAVGALIEARSGVPAPEEYARACHEVSRGNPLFLMSVLRDPAADGRPMEDDHGGHRVRALRPAELRDRLAGFLRTQPPAVRALAVAIAAFGDHGAPVGPVDPVDPALVARLAGLDEPGYRAAHHALRASGLLADGCEPRFSHRVVQDAVASVTTPAERERAHHDAADLLHRSGCPAEQVAVHLMAVTALGRPWAAALLRSAAGTALRRGAPDTAARYLRHALLDHRARHRGGDGNGEGSGDGNGEGNEEGNGEGRGDGYAGGSGTEDRGRAALLVELATVERGFDPEACERHVIQAMPLLPDAYDRAVAALRIPPALFARMSPSAEALLREAADRLGPAHRLDERAREPALRLEARLRHNGHESPRELAAAASRLRALGEEPPLDSAADRELLAVLLCSGTLTGQLRADTVARTARRVLDREPAASAGIHTTLPLLVIALYAAGAVRSAGSWPAVEQRDRRQHATGADGVLAFAQWALVLVARGRPAQAREYVERAMALADTDWREVSTVVLSAVALELRDPALSERILDRARRHHPAGLALTASLCILRASVDEQHGRRAEALATLLGCGRRLDAAGWRNSALFPWRPHAVALHHRLGDTESALRLAEEEHRWAAGWGAPAGLGRALRLKGRLYLGRGGVPLLREAVDVLRGSPYELELARTLVLLGRRLGTGPEAAAALREAGTLAAACGAPWLTERAEHVLGTAAAPRTAVLTGSERRVISLVNRGLTNHEIAGELGVSTRAVEKHLTNSYRKLGIAGRRELAAALPG